MNTSEQYHQPVLEALCAFVRDNAKAKIDKEKAKDKGPKLLATDIQAALTVIGRRKPGPGRVNLSGANLNYANLYGANLSDAFLSGAFLSDAYLSDAYLSGANLNFAILSGANLSGAILNYANGLSQNQMDTACGDKDTKLHSGLTIKPCR